MRKLFIPLTLERVGSEGKFFTDNTILKLFGTIIGSFLIPALIWSGLRLMIPGFILVPFIIIIGILFFYYATRFWVLREHELFRLLKKMEQHKVVNVGEFADVYDIQDGICFHNSGHISAFIKVVRGSTLSMEEGDMERYYQSIANFENMLLNNNYGFKVYNFESPIVRETIFTEQRDSCRKQGYKSLENNLNLKNTYTKIFMEEAMRDEQFIYAIVTQDMDIEHFKLKLKQAQTVLIGNFMKDIHIMDETEILNFATEFFDVKYFEFETDSEEDIEDFLELVE